MSYSDPAARTTPTARQAPNAWSGGTARTLYVAGRGPGGEVEPRRIRRLVFAGFLPRVEAGAVGKGGDPRERPPVEAVLRVPAIPFAFAD